MKLGCYYSAQAQLLPVAESGGFGPARVPPPGLARSRGCIATRCLSAFSGCAPRSGERRVPRKTLRHAGDPPLPFPLSGRGETRPFLTVTQRPGGALSSAVRAVEVPPGEAAPGGSPALPPAGAARSCR